MVAQEHKAIFDKDKGREAKVKELQVQRELMQTDLNADGDPNLTAWKQFQMDMRDWNKLMAPSSGNSTGGVGSVYKDVQEKILNGEMKKGWDNWKLAFTDYDKLSHERNMDVSKQQDFEQDKAKLLGGDRSEVPEGADKAQEAGQQKAVDVVTNASTSLHDLVVNKFSEPDFRVLLAKPPKDIGEMEANRKKAEEAGARHATAHANAYKSYIAEQAAEASINESQALLDKEGKPLKQLTDAQRPGMEEGKSKAQSRKSTLSGVKPGTKKSDPSTSNVAGQSTGKLKEGDESMKDKPDGGKTSAMGTDSAKAQDTTDKEANEATDASKAVSDEEVCAVDSLLTIQGEFVDGLNTKNAELDAKIAMDEGLKTEIQGDKVKFVQDRDTAGSEAESLAGQYNADVMEMTAWASSYRTARESFTSSVSK